MSIFDRMDNGRDTKAKTNQREREVRSQAIRVRSAATQLRYLASSVCSADNSLEERGVGVSELLGG